MDPANDMEPFIGNEFEDSLPGNANGFIWIPAASDTIAFNVENYVYQLYQFDTPVSEGSWCNSDNADFFSSYPQTNLTIHCEENIYDHQLQLFLVFQGVNSMVHVYNSNYHDFVYYYAPQGLSCTAVVIGVKDGNLYAGFMPLSIGANQTFTAHLNQTTTAEFKQQLEALN